MCGICGICTDKPGAMVDALALGAMNGTLRHRGPDGEGSHLDHGVGLAHRRLSIIDLAGGDQPIFNEDRSVAIVFNGEIYNYRELRQELIQSGHSFSTHSDTEVIVHLYEEDGEECVHKLNGMFAFAIWDKPRERLFCARDRFGEKPFYYTVHNKCFYFSSELKSFATIHGIDTDIDIEAMDDYLAYGYIPAPRTIYKSIHKLPQAHTLSWTAGRLVTSRYWTPTFPLTPLDISEQEAIERLRDLLMDSVRLRLRSDVPVGAFLSGGIDSSLIVSMAAQLAETDLSTFSVGFSEKDFDELGYARLVADRYGTDHHEIMIQDMDLSIFPQIVSHFDEPFGDASAIPTYYVTREAARYLKVCISGDAGDELFCGYTRYCWEPFEQIADKIPSGFRKLALNGLAEVLPDYVSGKGRLRRFAQSGHLRYMAKIAAFDAYERAAILRPEYATAIDYKAKYLEPYFRRRDLDPISQRMLADQNTYLTDDILVKVDRNSMWHSLEVRVPFLDHRIVDFANALPLKLKKNGHQQKYLLKQVMKGLVPDEIIERGKKGFGLPLVHWLRDQLDSFSSELLLSADTRSTQFFQPAAVKQLLANHHRGQRDLSRRIWTLLWFEQWCRCNKV